MDLETIHAAWRGWALVKGDLVDPAGVIHTPTTIRCWFWVQQELQHLRARENQRAASLPSNVHPLPSARPAHALTEEFYRRLEQQQ